MIFSYRIFLCHHQLKISLASWLFSLQYTIDISSHWLNFPSLYWYNIISCLLYFISELISFHAQMLKFWYYMRLVSLFDIFIIFFGFNAFPLTSHIHTPSYVAKSAYQIQESISALHGALRVWLFCLFILIWDFALPQMPESLQDFMILVSFQLYFYYNMPIISIYLIFSRLVISSIIISFLTALLHY